MIREEIPTLKFDTSFAERVSLICIEMTLPTPQFTCRGNSRWISGLTFESFNQWGSEFRQDNCRKDFPNLLKKCRFEASFASGKAARSDAAYESFILRHDINSGNLTRKWDSQV